MQKNIIFILLFLVLILLFALFNQSVIQVSVGFAKFDVYLPILIGICIFLGMGLQALLSLRGSFKKRSQINELKKQNAELSQQLINVNRQSNVVIPEVKTEDIVETHEPTVSE